MRVVFALGVGVFALALAAGVVQSLRVEHRLPAPGLLIYGAAEHVETLLAQGDYAGAVRQLRLYTAVATDRLPHDELGNILLRLGPEARAGFEEALRSEPDYANGHYQLGLVYLTEENLESAATHLEQAARLRPDFAEGHNTLGVVLTKQGKLAEAAAHFRQAVMLQPDYSDALENLVQVSQALEGATTP